jgi:hypothetical protein
VSDTGRQRVCDESRCHLALDGYVCRAGWQHVGGTIERCHAQSWSGFLSAYHSVDTPQKKTGLL